MEAGAYANINSPFQSTKCMSKQHKTKLDLRNIVDNWTLVSVISANVPNTTC